MYSSERIFIMIFIACLKKLGVTKIPCDDPRFDKGAENMCAYFQENREQLGKYSNELAMLFLRNSFGGTFSELRLGIQRQNGKLMSFDNPHYIHAIIELDEQGADYILDQNKNNIDITNEHMYQMSRAFCEGANISIT